MQQHTSKYFADRPLTPPRPCGRGLNSTFSEHGNVAYQIKGNHQRSNMVANILPADPPPPDPRDGFKRSKLNFFRTWSCCISIKRELRMQQNGSKYFARRPLPPPTLWVGSKDQNSTLSDNGHVAYQI